MTTVQAAFQSFYPSYQAHYKASFQQAKATKNILKCKTSALGGHVSACDCGHVEVYYNSCRDRHCPMCQGVTKAMWVDQRCKDAIEAPYFHVVFTMPQELQSLIYQNQRLLYNLMYKAISETLLELSLDPKHLGAQPGFFSILHTWGQDLHYHPHIHTVVMAGGLTKLNKWKSSSKKFFIPVKVLSKIFRGKYLHYLKQYYHEQLLTFHGDSEQLQKPQKFQELLDDCYRKNWYSYSKEALAGPLAVIEYLGRYTHRIAISNSRIASVNEETVTIRVRDNKDNQKRKTLTMQGTEFVRRFLMHILPHRFVKVRYYGILATRNKKTKLALCRKLTSSVLYKPKFEGLSALEVLTLVLGRDITKCPVCQKEKRRLLVPRASPAVA
ncbi:MAG: IS91 family transposase [Peptococcaceae bacterium]|nr:IS91 family transposase [Peptococcaceae bacterium]